MLVIFERNQPRKYYQGKKKVMKSQTKIKLAVHVTQELVVHTGVPVLQVCLTGGTVSRYGCSYRYTRLLPETHLGKCRAFLKGKSFVLINTANSREIQLSQIPKENQMCGNASMYVSKRQTLMLILLYVNSAVPLSNLREAPQTWQRIRNATGPYFCLGHLWGTNGRSTCLTPKLVS